MACNVHIANSPLVAAAPKITSNRLKKTNTAKVSLTAPFRSNNKNYGLGAMISATSFPNSKTWNYRNRVVVVRASAYITVRNGTKQNLDYAGHYTWEGHVIGQYPNPIGLNAHGVGFFTHVGIPEFQQGSISAVVYRVKNIYGNHFDWMFAWEAPFPGSGKTNKVYTEIREVGNFCGDENWNSIRDDLDKSDLKAEVKVNKLTATVNIDDGDEPNVKVLIKNE